MAHDDQWSLGHHAPYHIWHHNDVIRAKGIRSNLKKESKDLLFTYNTVDADDLATQEEPQHQQASNILAGHDYINTLRPRRNEQHFADDIFFNENVWISIKISLKFVPKGPINTIPALVQIMAWRRSGDKPLSEPMMVSLPTHIWVTRPQWVNKDWRTYCLVCALLHEGNLFYSRPPYRKHDLHKKHCKHQTVRHNL